MNKKTFLALFIAILISNFKSFSQNPHIAQFTSKMNVLRVVTDNKYVWIGHTNGLSRLEIATENIKRHKVFYALVGINWQPGARYVELPDRKINIGSKYPVFSFQYIRSFNGFLGSDADFSKWRFAVSDNINLKLRGVFRYRVGMGGFIDNDKVQLPDYTHFNGNISTLATEYLNSFQLLPIYQYSNTDKFYSLAHLEYNLKGFLTNKIPVFRKLNFYLVTGANGFYINGDKNYYEWFIGFDNIFKQIRVDFVQSWQNGKSWQNGFRIGLTRFGGQRGDDWP